MSIPTRSIRDVRFLSRTGTVLILVSLALFIAGALSKLFWFRLFDCVFPSDVSTLSVQELAIKPMVNIVMYAIPFTFYFLAAGVLTAGLISLVTGDIRRWQNRRGK